MQKDKRIENRLCQIKCFLLDMDGTIYLGDKLLPRAKEFIEYLRASDRNFLFLTNNSSKDKESYANKLNRLGVICNADDILTSGEATCSYLKSLKVSARVFLMGTPELEKEFKKWGFVLTDEKPDYVVLGFDKTLTYKKLSTACTLIRSGVLFIATHPDFNCPTENGYIPDCGAMIEFIKASTGVLPKVIGKPNKEIIESAFRKREYALNEYAIVGDRLYTDIAAGNNAGVCSILVLSGEATLADAEKSEVKPFFIVKNVAEILECLQQGDK
ncbi:MAG: HAD-IIA family hydrolase [Selenomonadaceae bacterium]